MLSEVRACGRNVLVIHHDAVVLEDLCETLREAHGSIRVDRATSLSPHDIHAPAYDAALIEVSGNETTLCDAGDRLSNVARRVVWITDDFHPAPDATPFRAHLKQPFRTEDVTAALRAAGFFASRGEAPQA